MFRHLVRRFWSSSRTLTRSTGRAAPRRRSARFEPLEGRCLLSIAYPAPSPDRLEESGQVTEYLTSGETDPVFLPLAPDYANLESDPLRPIVQDGALLLLFRQYEAYLAAGGDPGTFQPTSSLSSVLYADGWVSVRLASDHDLLIPAVDDPASLVVADQPFFDQLAAYEFMESSVSPRLVAGRLPLASLGDLAGDSGVQTITGGTHAVLWSDASTSTSDVRLAGSHDYGSDSLSPFLSTDLIQLYREYDAFVGARGDAQDFELSEPGIAFRFDCGLRRENGQLRVAISIVADHDVVPSRSARANIPADGGDPDAQRDEAFLARLRDIGVTDLRPYENVVSGMIDVSDLPRLSTLTGLRRVESPAGALTNAGLTTTQGVPRPTMVVLGDGPVTIIDDTTARDSDTDSTIDELTREAIGENKDGPMAKVGWDLTYLYFEFGAFVEGGGDASEFTPSNSLLRFEEGRVALEVSTTEPLTYDEVDEWGHVEHVTSGQLIAELETAGLEVSGASGHLTGGWLRADAIDDLAALSAVASAWPAIGDSYGPAIHPPVVPSDLLPTGPAIDNPWLIVGDSYGPAIHPPVVPSDLLPTGPAIDELARQAIGENEDGPMAKMGWDLAYVYFEYEAFVDGGRDPSKFTASNTSLPVEDGQVLVKVLTSQPMTYQQADEWGQVDTVTNWRLVEQLEGTGLELTGYSGMSGSAWLPLGSIDDLAALESVRSVYPEYRGLSDPAPIDGSAVPTMDWDQARYAYQNNDGGLGKVGWDLTRVYYEYKATIDAGLSGTDYAPSLPWFPLRDQRVLVKFITSEPLTVRERDEWGGSEVITNWKLIEELVAAGLEPTAYSGSSGSAWLPLWAIDDVAGSEVIRAIYPAYAGTSIGATTSQGDTAIVADDVRALKNVDGEGTVVGVISGTFSSVNPNGTATDIQTGDLPPDVQIVVEGSLGLDEGRAMSQIVHDVAPGADIVFHTAGVGDEYLAAAIRTLAANGAHVIVDDVRFSNDPMFLDGHHLAAWEDGGSAFATLRQISSPTWWSRAAYFDRVYAYSNSWFGDSDEDTSPGFAWLHTVGTWL